MPSQASVIEAGARPGRLEHARGRREADRRHAVAGDVEHGERGGVERVVVARGDVADRRDVGRQLPCLPAGAADQEPALGQLPCRLEEERLDTRLAVGQAVAEEGEVGGKRGSGGTGWCVAGSSAL